MKKADAATFLKVAQLVGQRLPLTEVYRECHEVLREWMDAENFYVGLAGPEDTMLFPYNNDERDPLDGLEIMPKAGLTGYVIDHGHTVQLIYRPDLVEDHVYIGPESSDWIGVPLQDRDGMSFGMIAVQSYQPGYRYQATQVLLVEYIASQLSLALQLHFHDRDRAIRELAAVIEDTTNLADLYNSIHRITGSIIPAARHHLFIARVHEEEGLFKLAYSYNPNEDDVPTSWPLDLGASGHIYTSLKKSFIYNYKEPEKRLPFFGTGQPASYWLGAPLFSHDRIIGVVVIQSFSPDMPISRDDETSLNALCPHIAMAIERIEFFERTFRG